MSMTAAAALLQNDTIYSHILTVLILVIIYNPATLQT